MQGKLSRKLLRFISRESRGIMSGYLGITEKQMETTI